MPSSAKQPIIILDDSQSENDNSDFSSKKRKIEHSIYEKVHLTDDEHDPLPHKPTKKRAKRKSIGPGKEKGTAGKGKSRSSTKRRGYDHVGDGQPVDDDDVDLAGIPEYLQQRWREFDANKKKYHEAALMLPPDYSGLSFQDPSARLAELEERPRFDQGSGIRPSRPYDDIKLPQSAGLVPASIAQYLRDYQIAGVKFLHKKFVYQEGAILGDDMGLGKTVQVAAFLTAAFGKTGDERDAKRMRQVRYDRDRWYPRVLVICPGSLIMNWRNELNRWGWWHVDLYHGPDKDDILSTARAGLLEIMITTYDTYKNSRSQVNMVAWDAVIADECHRLKDRYSATTKAMVEVNALCRIGLTGTAIQNNYEELWTLLDWTNPGHFGTQAEWRDTISRPLTVGQSHEATASQLALARTTAKKLVENLLPRYFLRRMKSLIADQLPKKTDRVVFCPLTDLQRDAYENFLDSAEIDILRRVSETCEHGNTRGWCCGKFLPSGEPWQKIVFPSMVVLQKLANHLNLLVPITADTEARHKTELHNLRVCLPNTWEELYRQRDQIRNLVNAEFCGKWKVLKRLLKFWHSNGDKVLVFSHSVRLLRILQHLFTNTSYSVSYLDGSLTYEQRQDIVDTFNTDPTQFVFLISTKAGGMGLNITSANKVVIVDPHWNPSYDLQAQDRAYRIGQTRDVEVFRLISLGTIEEIVYARQVYKQQQANIGYTASSERRYFKGVQNESERKGEIFGLHNIFAYHPDSGLLREIVNKTNIAEAKAGVHLADMDMEDAAKDEELDLGGVKKEEGYEDGGLSQLADFLISENKKKKKKDTQDATKQAVAAVPRKSDAIQAILTSAGVEYFHDNAQVVGSSRIEERLSRQVAAVDYDSTTLEGTHALFKSTQTDSEEEEADDALARGVSSDEPGVEWRALHSRYNPPEEVRRRQFCEMSREFGFVGVTEFATVVEGWDGEGRRNCLDAFYKRREDKLKREAGEAAMKDAENKGHDEKKDIILAMKHDDDTKVEPEMEDTEDKMKDDDDKKKDDDDKKKDDDDKMEDTDNKMKDTRDKMEDTKDKMKEDDDKKKDDDDKTKFTAKSEIKSTNVQSRDEGTIMQQAKTEGSSKRTSIFLSDDDENDGL